MVEQKTKNLLAGMIIRTLFGYSVFNFVLLSLTLEIAFSITEVGVGALMAAYWVPAICLQFRIARYANVIGENKLIVLGALIVSAGSFIISQALSFEFILIGRFISGVGAILFWTPGIVIVSNVYPKDKISFVTALIVLSYGIGTLFAMYLVPAQELLFGWRTIFLITSIYGLAVTVIAHLLTKNQRSERKKLPCSIRVAQSRELLKIAVAQSLSMAVWTVFLTFFARTLIIEKMIDPALASFTLIVASIGGIVFALVGGYLADIKYSRGLWIAVPLMFLSLIFFLVSFLAGVFYIVDLLLSWLIGALVWIPQGSIWSLPKIIEPDNPNTAMSLLVIITGIGATTLPVLFGLIVDFTGSFFYGYIFLALSVLFASLVSYRIKR